MAAVLNIHLIDPDPRFRRLLAAALEPYGHRILQSVSLREAELELPVAHPDLIIMDGLQPDGDGLEWLKTQRANGLKTPVFFLSSSCHSTEHFCQLLSDLKVKAVLHKPITAATLERLFEEHFRKTGDPAAAGSPTDIDEIERELAALADEYVRELPERFAVLKRQVSDLKVGLGEPDTAKNEAHKIKGTASSYGVHEIGKQAVIIDECLKDVCKGSLVTPDLWLRLDNALNEAARLSDEAVLARNSQAAVPAVYDEGTAMKNIGLSTARGQTIVIVDDDPDFTKRVSLVLGYEDMLVYSFQDAKRIIEVLAYLEPDLLILDMNMPDIDGFEVCKRVRIDGRFKKLPIVFLTAQTGWETRVAAFDAGADDYIPKPVVNQELIARIRVRAEKSRLQEEVNSQSSVNKLLWQALLLVLLQDKSAVK